MPAAACLSNERAISRYGGCTGRQGFSVEIKLQVPSCFAPQTGSLFFVALSIESLREAFAAVTANMRLKLQVSSDVVAHVGKSLRAHAAQPTSQDLLQSVCFPIEFSFRFKKRVNDCCLNICAHFCDSSCSLWRLRLFSDSI